MYIRKNHHSNLTEKMTIEMNIMMELTALKAVKKKVLYSRAPIP